MEQKTGYPKAWFFVAGCVVIFSFVLLLGGSKLVVDVLGFVYPAYMSFKSMDTGNHKDNTQWLTYWVVFSFLSIMETLFQFLVDFIPMYYFFKIGVIIVRFVKQKISLFSFLFLIFSMNCFLTILFPFKNLLNHTRFDSIRFDKWSIENKIDETKSNNIVFS